MERAKSILNSQIFRLVGLSIEVLDASLLYVLFLQTTHYLLVGAHLQLFPQFLQLQLLLPLSLQLFRSFFFPQGTNYQNFSALFDILNK